MRFLFSTSFQDVQQRSVDRPKILFTTLILIIFTGTAKAQLSSVKFELFKDKVYFNVTFKGHESDTLRFLFDTGAEAGVLDSITAAKLFGKGQFERSEVVDAGGVSYRRSLKKQTIFVGGVTIKNVDLVIQDLQPLYRGKPSMVLSVITCLKRL